MTIEDRRRRRVVASHQIAFTAFRLAGGFALVSVGWSLAVLLTGGSWWGPVHAFLLGTVSLAIAGASQLFTITWSAAPAPRAVTAAAQRWSLSIGAAAVLAGVTIHRVGVVVVGGVAVVVGLVLLAVSLMGAVRRSLLRRFDLSARFYLLGIGCAVIGVALGVLMAIGFTGDQYSRFRLVHGHLNLVGFIGFTIIGTLPTILPTFAHHRVVSGREAILGWRVAIVAAVAMVAGLGLGEPAVALGTFLAAMALVLVTAGIVVRLGRQGVKGGLPYLQVVLGCFWLLAWAAVDVARLITGTSTPAFDEWIAAVVIAGVGQVLLGSLAYLLPVLLGPGPTLGRNAERFERHRWLPLVGANGAAVAIVAGAPLFALIAVSIWVIDFIRRVLSLERGSAHRG